MKLGYLIVAAGLLMTVSACSKAPTSPAADAEAAKTTVSAPPVPAGDTRTIKDLMDSLIDPSGDFLFESVQEIANDKGITKKQPRTDAEWALVAHHFTVLQQASDLLIMEGRRSARPEDKPEHPEVENPPEEVQKLMDAERPEFIRRAKALQAVAGDGLKAVEAKDVAALSATLLAMDKACESCHLHFWYPNDKRAHQAAKEEGVPE